MEGRLDMNAPMEETDGRHQNDHFDPGGKTPTGFTGA
jgi:hypothetical protein